MTAAYTDVITYAPEFSTLTQTTIDLFLGFASNQVSESAFGLNYDQAIILLTCHMLKMRPSASGVLSGGGLVTSETVGQLSRSYSVPQSSGTNSNFSTTSYGIEYQRLIDQLIVSPITAGCY